MTYPTSRSAAPNLVNHRVPLSPLQEDMLLEHLLEPESGSNLPQFVGTLDDEEIDYERFLKAFEVLIRCHPALRSRLQWEGLDRPCQELAPDLGQAPFRWVNWEVLDAGEQDRSLAEYLREDRERGMQLDASPLHRLVLIRLGPRRHILVWTFHHAILDGRSCTRLIQELFETYGSWNRRNGTEETSAAASEASDLGQPRWPECTPETREFWERHLGQLGSPSFLDRWDEADSPDREWKLDADLAPHFLTEETTERLRSLAKAESCTVNTIVLAAWAIFVHRHTGAGEVVFGTIRDCRKGLGPAAASALGMLINVVPIRVEIDRATPVISLLQSIRTVWVDMRDHAHAPLARIQEWAGQPRPRALFDTMVVFDHETPTARLRRLGAEWQDRTFFFRQRHSLPVVLSIHADARLRIQLEVRPDRFGREAAERLTRQFAILLEALAKEPGARVGDISMLSPDERHWILETWNPRPAMISRGEGIHHLLQEQCRRTPDAPAVEGESEVLSYRQLDARAERLASQLLACGIGPRSRVALHCERSPALIVGVLGILKSGAAYVPLDPELPKARLDLMLAESGAGAIVSSRPQDWMLQGSGCIILSLDDPQAATSPAVHQASTAGFDDESTAYVIFTSGSSGRPRGVLVPHRALVGFVRAAIDTYPILPSDRVLQFATIGFDASVEEIFPVLACGGTVVLRTPTMLASMATFLRECRARTISMLSLPTAFWHDLVSAWDTERLELPPSLRLVVLGGERVHPPRVAEWSLRVGGKVRLLNTYGPTEATVVATSWEIRHVGEPSGEIPIGRPLPNCRVYVIDCDGQLAPAGVRGEITIGGEGLAQGYLALPDLTREKFVTDPFSEAPDSRLYRTGDLGRWQARGVLEFLGRIDRQVKVRGFRVEPEEIEALLEGHPGIRSAVAVPHAGNSGSQLVKAYVVPRTPGELDWRTLRGWLGERAPEYLIPSEIIEVADLPRTPNGKVDRSSLSPKLGRLLPKGVEFTAPSSESELRVAGIWKGLLGRDEIGLHDDFFELGGHSLLAIQLVARLKPVFGREIALRTLFDHPTISGLLRHLDSGTLAESQGIPPLHARPRHGQRFPLSFAQQRLWFIDQLEESSTAYHMAAAYRLIGPLDVEILERALQAIVDRHESLRTRFVVQDGEPAQVIESGLRASLPVIDLQPVAPERRSEAVQDHLRGEWSSRFRLDSAPLLRLALFRLGAEEHVLCRCFHHIVSDGWSIGVFHRELSELYRAFRQGLPDPLPPLSVHYSDYTLWQREWLAGEELNRQIQYWRDRLSGTPSLELHADRPRPSTPTHSGYVHPFRLPAATLPALASLQRDEDVTPFMVFMAAFQVFLARHSGQTDFAVGTPVANRRVPELELLQGFFVNTLALRADLGGDPTFRELLARVRRRTMEALEHQDLPFERLVQDLNPARDTSRHPIFQVLLAVHNTPQHPLALPEVRTLPYPVPISTTHFELELHLLREADAWTGWLACSTERFDPATAERMLDHYARLLDVLATHPDEGVWHALPVPESMEARTMLEPIVQVLHSPPRARTVIDLFLAQAERTPEAVAWRAGGEFQSYARLRARALALAAHLRSTGVPPGSPVGLCLERGPDLIVAALSIVLAGAAYMPLDPLYPDERLTRLWEQSGASHLVTRGRHRPISRLARVLVDLEELPPHPDEEPGPADVAPEQLAYVLFTSGSTGVPKAVEMPHRALINLIQWQIATSRMGPGDRTLQFANLGFDVSFQEIFSTWCSGGTLILVSDDTRRDPEELLREIAQSRIHRLFLPCVMFDRLVEAALRAPDLDLGALREINVAGEQLLLRPETRRLFRRLPQARLWNHYGPTEAHVVTAYCLPESPEAWPVAPPIGRPLPGCRILILDEALHPVPDGVPGEICIAGIALARGYLGRPDLTTARFVPHPFVPGERLYRTGDRGRRHSDGHLEFLGRLDDRVKIRGHLVEPIEIEVALARHPAVAQAIVLASGAGTGEGQLRGFVVVKPGREAEIGTASQLRSFLLERLPEHMIPGSFVLLPSLPLSPNGKVDRRALADTNVASLPASTEFRAPTTARERQVAEVWQSVLRRPTVGLHDDFFESGGDSLRAVQLVARLRPVLGHEIKVRTLFDHPTIARLVAHVGAAPPEAMPAVPALRACSDQGARIPCSFTQQRLWFIGKFEGSSTVYHIPVAHRLRGPLDVDALHRALLAIVGRHGVLRTCLIETGDAPSQVVDAQAGIDLPVFDLADLPPARQSSDVDALLHRESTRAFDLGIAPLFRVVLIRLAPGDSILLLVFHHVVSDGWSIGIFHRELGELYRAFLLGRPDPLPALPVQYADYTLWQHEWLACPEANRQLEYWRRRLADIGSLDLPTDHPRPTTPNHAGARLDFRLPPERLSDLASLQRQEDATPFMIFLAAFQVLLARHSGQSDFAVGTPAANRRVPELELLQGFFVNTLALRADLGGDPTFRQLLARVRRSTLDAFDHQDLPFERVVQELNPERDPSRHPLFQVLLAVQNAPQHPLALDGVETSTYPLAATTTAFDLQIHLVPCADGWSGQCHYATALFDAGTISRFIGHYLVLLEDLLAHPDHRVFEAQLLTPSERRQLVSEWGEPAMPHPRHLTAHDLFGAQAKRTPDAVALASEEGTVTYRQLDRRSNQLARWLIARGVRPEQPVALGVVRSPDAIVALLAILKAGAAYLPIDPLLPGARRAFILRDAAATMILVSAEGTTTVASDPAAGMEPLGVQSVELILALEDAAAMDDAPLAIPTSPRSPAYFMYTSGTTGTPKGVVISHLGIVRLVARPDFLRVDSSDVILQYAPLSFDASTLEIWAGLAHGARLFLPPPGPADVPVLGRWIQQHDVSILWLTAALFRQVVEQMPAALAGVRQVLAGGDVLDPTTVSRFFEIPNHGRLINGYGPTENTTFTTCHAMDRAPEPGRPVPIGRAIAGTYVRILDPRDQLVPIGVPGQLHAGGDGLALGYLGRPELTAERFIPDPFANPGEGRLYRTGDLARFLPDGTIEFLGRLDQQVKIRGFRVEPAEIEIVLAAHPAIDQAVVIADKAPSGDARLRAFAVRKPHPSGEEPTIHQLREFLAERLPDYMIPARFAWVPSLPWTSHGKLDRQALARLDTRDLAPGAAYSPPETDLECELVRIWEELLQRKPIGIRDNFFALGGHSLLAIRIAARVRQSLRLEVSVGAFFANPTVEALARKLANRQDEGGASTTGFRNPATIGTNAMAPIPPRDPARYRISSPGVVPAGSEAIPASPFQFRLWLAAQANQGPHAYLIPDVLRLEGNLRLPALVGALSDLVQRHEAFRTSFDEVDGTLHQIVHPRVEVEPEFHDLTATPDSMPAPESESALATALAADATSAFDLSVAPLVRFKIYRTGPATHVLSMVTHHLVSDGWSLDIVHRELPELYRNRCLDQPSSLPPVPVHYADFSAWQSDQGTSPRVTGDLGAILDEAPEYSSLSPDMFPEQPTFVGRELRHRIDGPEWSALLDLCQAEELTPFMGLFGLFVLLLGRHARRDDLVLGAPVVIRDRPELESVIGAFINVLPLRCRWSENQTLREFLRHVREVTLTAFNRRMVPFEEVLEGLALPRVGGRMPLVQVLFNLVPPQSISPRAWADVQATRVDVPCRFSKFDLTLYASVEPDHADLNLVYRADLYTEDRLRDWLNQLHHLVREAPRALSRSLGTISLVHPGATRLLPTPGLPLLAPQPSCLLSTIDAWAAGSPGTMPALESATTTVSRSALRESTLHLAHALSALLDGEPRTVGVFGPRSMGVIVGCLAVLRAGGVLLTLDLHLPEDRLRTMLREAKTAVLIRVGGPEDALDFLQDEATHVLRVDALSGRLQAAPTSPPPDFPTLPPNDRPAYLFFTSGSTGVPKAVLGTRRGLDHFVEWQRATFEIGPRDRAAHLTGMSFDVVLRDMLTPLSAGAVLCLPARDADLAPDRLLTWLARERITLLHAVPSLAQAWLDAAPEDLRLPDLRCVFFAGEPLPEPLVRRWQRLSPRCRIINLYGPTETTLAKCHHEVVGAPLPGTQPVGRPMPGAQVLVLGPSLRPCGIGEPGELAIRTPFRTLGYANDPEATRARFVRNPWTDAPDDLLYLTGDLGRYRPDGSLDILGRADSQLKIRGVRVEPGEVSATIRLHPAVRECAVHARELPGTGRCLVAVIAPASGQTAPEMAPALNAFLRQRLPVAFLPAHYLFVERLPLTPNGKIDRAALERIPLPSKSESPTPPLDESEQRIADLWLEILPPQKLEPESDFFECGGQSMQALQFLSRAERTLGLRTTLGDFFARPTISGMAALVRGCPAPSPIPGPGSRRRTRRGVSLFFIPGYFGLGTIGPSLTHALRDVMPVYDRLRYAGVDGDAKPHDRLEDIADHLILQIEEMHPPGLGPVCLAGFSFGGTVAYEVARRLASRGRDVPLLLLYDTRFPKHFRRRSTPELLLELVRRLASRPRGGRFSFAGGLLKARIQALAHRWQGGRLGTPTPSSTHRTSESRSSTVEAERNHSPLLKESVRLACEEAFRHYSPLPYAGRTVLFKATQVVPNEWLRLEIPKCNGWSRHVTGPFEIVPVAREHLGVFTEPLDPVVLTRTAGLLSEIQTAHRARPPQ